MPIPLIVPLAIMAASAIPKIVKNIKTAKDAKAAAKRINVNDNSRTEAQRKLAEQNMTMLQNSYNTGMLPGQAYEQQQLLDDAANTGASFDKNATNASMRLALGSGLQEQLQAGQRAQNAQFGQQKFQQQGLLSSSGYGGMIDYERFAYGDRQTAQDAKNRLMQTAHDASTNTFDMIQQMGSSVGGSMLAGDFGAIGGNTKGFKLPPRVANTPQALAGSQGFGTTANFLTPSYRSIGTQSRLPSLQMPTQNLDPRLMQQWFNPTNQRR